MLHEILITLDLDAALVERIAALDPTLHVRVLGRGTRAGSGGRLLYPSELQRAVPRAEIEAALPDAEVLLSAWYGTLRHLDLATAAPRLRWVQLMHAGVDTVDPALVHDVTFTSAGPALAGPIAEWVIGCMSMFAKGWPAAWRDQQAHVWGHYMPRDLAGATVGIVGLGGIGTAVARRASALGCRVIAVRRSATARGTAPFVDEVLPTGDLDRLLGASDYVVLAAPLTAETRGLINARSLAAMRRDAVLLNVARGGLVDEAALVEALRAGTIAGAALDVFEREPLPADSPLWDLENVVISPHIAAGSERFYERVTDLFCANLARYLAGEPLEHVVDPSRGY